ncbi:MAG TPA: rhodanese-like domain-containing protein [Kiritimatiellia bacterium]|nr:rhodanese-like domain-containing protein [Kiritimatiellia bacterium]HRZ12538.1 rhodanese-like domain-containing protein [Kiritimatiellia bacterium]HSA17616.1 rhodanese-like domain-containing protein [Kiritimatiellia bacterium]
MNEEGSSLRPNSATALRVAGLLLMAAVAGGLANLAHPRKIAWVEDWSRYIEARALAAGFRLADTATTREIVENRSHLIFDARPAMDFKAGHLPGAVSLPYDAVQNEFQNVAVLLLGGQPILTYCSGLVCDESFLLTEFLRQQGTTNIVLYSGGYEEWTRAGLPVEGRP